MKCNVSFEYELFGNVQELEGSLQKLLTAAKEAVGLSYAPYSKFHVGAALLLSNGEIVKGSNQENASSPAGICAERVALSASSSVFPQEKIIAIAITYHNESAEEEADNIVSPCGICRQSLLEATDRQQSPIRVLLASPSGKLILLENAAHLLPLAFSASDL
ncbi:cytidine deaminase [Dyadobacter luticola]|uniref:Cytidine deaminase n=1 Tax=Dyadobacter luticola TaxID=1979387 RepID=A0A5R9L363_9BACT|nr:cytidine deaminase [Dyadobacter luticola]TLV02700.1 cytidine deaminase [Dyadobacter luticola]